MGYLRPTALVVTGLYEQQEVYERPRQHWAAVAREAALDIFHSVSRESPGWEQLERIPLSACVSELSPRLWNSSRSFCVFWDGSKEGWPPSEVMDLALERFVVWLREQAYGDGSSPLHWVWVRYGGDDREAVVLAHSGERAGVELDPAERPV